MSIAQGSRRREQGAGREVFERQRMILERAVPVGLRWVTGVARFGEQTQIGESPAFDQLPRPGVRSRSVCNDERSVQMDSRQCDDADGEKSERRSRFSVDLDGGG